jgi:hypothetical protein
LLDLWEKKGGEGNKSLIIQTRQRKNVLHLANIPFYSCCVIIKLDTLQIKRENKKGKREKHVFKVHGSSKLLSLFF